MISDLAPLLAQAAPQPQPGGLGGMLVPLVLFGVIMYFLAIRPQQQRQKALEALQASLKTGDRVITNSGIHGIIANVKEGKTLSLKIADNVKIEIDKNAIATIEKSDSAPTVS